MDQQTQKELSKQAPPIEPLENDLPPYDPSEKLHDIGKLYLLNLQQENNKEMSELNHPGWFDRVIKNIKGWFK
jgi:hypothetical protein